MPSLEARTSERTGRTSYRVIWWENGKREQETFAVESGARDFYDLVAAAKNHWPHGWVKGQGMITEQSSTAPTFRQWATASINSRTRANDRTRADYMRDLSRHVFPLLGDRHIDLITRHDIAAWVRQLGQPPDPLAPKTVRNVHALVSSLLTEAVNEGLLPRNPTAGTMRDVPTVKSEEMCFLLPTEAALLTEYMSEHYQSLVTTLFGTGMRWSEITALSVGSVDLFGRNTITVNRAWKRDEAGGFYLGEPKTSRSRRTLAIGDVVVDALIPLVASRSASEFLFTTHTGQVVRHSNFYSRVWLPGRARAQAAGLTKSPRIHDGRHTHVSWLIAEGLPLPAIQRRLGHASITTTIDRYGHLMPELDGQINAAVDRALGRPESRPTITPDTVTATNRVEEKQ